MATDSSSGTLPSSSRLTIDSSSSIARSKLSFLTSSWVFSAILRSRMRRSDPDPISLLSMIFSEPVSTFPDHVCQAHNHTKLRAYCGGELAAHQCADMSCDRLF